MSTPTGCVVWAVNGGDRSNKPTCSDAHEIKKRKNRRLMATTSRMRIHAPFVRTDPNICVWDGVPHIMNCANFFENRSRGLGAGIPRKTAFPIESDDDDWRTHYNSTIIQLLMYSKSCLGRCYINCASCLIIQEHIRFNQAHTGVDNNNSNKNA